MDNAQAAAEGPSQGRALRTKNCKTSRIAILMALTRNPSLDYPESAAGNQPHESLYTVFVCRYVAAHFAGDQEMLRTVVDVTALQLELYRERVEAVAGFQRVLSIARCADYRHAAIEGTDSFDV